MPPQNSASVITPIIFCASFVPWPMLYQAAENELQVLEQPVRVVIRIPAEDIEIRMVKIIAPSMPSSGAMMMKATIGRMPVTDTCRLHGHAAVDHDAGADGGESRADQAADDGVAARGGQAESQVMMFQTIAPSSAASSSVSLASLGTYRD